MKVSQSSCSRLQYIDTSNIPTTIYIMPFFASALSFGLSAIIHLIPMTIIRSHAIETAIAFNPGTHDSMDGVGVAWAFDVRSSVKTAARSIFLDFLPNFIVSYWLFSLLSLEG